jgi:hypothetical protein
VDVAISYLILRCVLQRRVSVARSCQVKDGSGAGVEAAPITSTGTSRARVVATTGDGRLALYFRSA